ncbi:MAG: YitT family protein [Clostridia bacterium]|nr:YitT family protein [Clostridia bacterium]
MAKRKNAVKNDASSEKTVRELVITEEEKIKKDDTGTKAFRKEIYTFPIILLGSLIYSFGMNVFLRPLGLYSGGMMGMAQLLQFFLAKVGMTFDGFNVSGVIYYLLNLPALIVAIKLMRRRFIIKTIIAITSITILLSVIPIPPSPVLDDMLTNTIIAGLICGTGIGLILWGGACDGGMNIVGMLIIAKKGRGSVGNLGLITNIVLYTVMLFLFDPAVALYSLIYSVFNSIAVDRIHTQNIASQVMVFTKCKDTRNMEVDVMGKLNRGMTQINASGMFTGEDVKIFLIFVSKFEVNRLRRIIKSHDEESFVVETPVTRIDGNFIRHVAQK